MWTAEKQKLYDTLRDKESFTVLSVDERQQIELLIAELDQSEFESLRPSLERMAQEHEQDQATIRQLQKEKELLTTLAAQEEQLVQRAKLVLQEVLREKARLRAEYEHALAGLSRAA